MNSTQFLLLAGGILFFTNLVLTFNRTSMSQALVVYENESFIYGEGLSQGLIEEIQTRAFDENTLSGTVDSPEGLSSVNGLGHDGGEDAMNKFDDIDDFDNFTFTDSLSGHGNFDVNISVYYINTYLPDVQSSLPTFSKRVDIAMNNPYMQGTVRVSKIFSY
jgi:hypothetical protein